MKVKKGCFLTRVGKKAVVAGDVQKNGNDVYLELNATAADVWECVEKGKTLPEIGAFLAEKYEVTAEQAERDAKIVIDRFVAAGYMEND